MSRALKERDATIMGGLTLLMLLLWLGFFVHRSPRFAGSLVGHSIGIAGAVLMLVPLAYSLVKRIGPLKRMITPKVPMRTLLAWHIYAGIVGPILVLAHTGHRFESPLGIALTSMTIIVVLSGYIGRYLLRHIGSELRDHKKLLKATEQELAHAASELARSADGGAGVLDRSRLWSRLRSTFFDPDPQSHGAAAIAGLRAVRLVETQADLELAIRTQETLKTWFGKWLKLHIAISLFLYALLVLHVWAVIHFGLRWIA